MLLQAAIAELQEFINNRPDAREVRKALAVKDALTLAKTWVRRFCALIPTFSDLKWMFEWFIRNTTFDFLSLQMYGVFSEIKY